MTRYGMVIDLEKCIGCDACTVACKAENSVARDIFWNVVYEKEKGKFPSVRRVFLPRPCYHCEEAPCVSVCPTKASYKRDDGIVMIKKERCIGCKYCIAACPYNARTLNHETDIAEKCTFCEHRLEEDKEPACVVTCIGNARFFGDLDDPESQVSLLIARKGGTQLLKDLGTEPVVYYLPLGGE